MEQYWVQWQVPLCFLAMAVPAVVSVKYTRTTTPQPLTSFQLWNCCWTNLSPFWLLSYRAFAFLCLALVLLQMVSHMGAFAFYFYTQWTFSLVVAYFGLATLISAQGCWNFRIGQNANSWGRLMLAMYHTSAGACVLTDLVFWCLLVPLQVNVQFELNFLIGCLHTLNAIFLIGDTALNGLPFSWSGFPNFVVWSCLYITFQWIVHACGFMTWWPYPFLELDTPWAPLWYLGISLFHIPCYWVYGLIIRAKKCLFQRLNRRP